MGYIVNQKSLPNVNGMLTVGADNVKSMVFSLNSHSAKREENLDCSVKSLFFFQPKNKIP